MTKPITPNQAKKKHITTIPDEIIETVNELLVKDSPHGEIIIRQDDLMKLVLPKLRQKNETITRGEVFDNNWFDFEPIFRKAGWKVKYDKPAYNESYEAYWAFSKK